MLLGISPELIFLEESFIPTHSPEITGWFPDALVAGQWKLGAFRHILEGASVGRRLPPVLGEIRLPDTRVLQTAKLLFYDWSLQLSVLSRMPARCPGVGIFVPIAHR